MSDRINKGDKVQIWWVDGEHLNAVVQYMPQASGDLMIVTDEHGDVRYINTGCVTFDQVIKQTKGGGDE